MFKLAVVASLAFTTVAAATELHDGAHDFGERSALNVASGMNFANGAATRTMTSNVKAWMIPAMGERPPHFTFVAVRAIAPVAAIPPNKGLAMFAKPCAMSS